MRLEGIVLAAGFVAGILVITGFAVAPVPAESSIISATEQGHIPEADCHQGFPHMGHEIGEDGVYCYCQGSQLQCVYT